MGNRNEKNAGSAESHFRRMLGRFFRSRSALIGSIGLSLLILIAAAAPILTGYDPYEIDPGKTRQAPSLEHPMGTDNYGRDIMTRVFYGARLSLRVGLISVSIGAGIGAVLGMISGYFGGTLDTILIGFLDLMLAFPGVLIAMLIVFMLGPSLQNAMLAVGIAGVPRFARLVRGSVISTKESEFVKAANALGAAHPRIIVRHIFPNILAPLMVFATLQVAFAIVFCAGLSFLGLGAQPPKPEWGSMLNAGRMYIRTSWWMTMFPGLMILVAALSINLIGDGLRDVLDPKLKN